MSALGYHLGGCAGCGGPIERPFWDDFCFACQAPDGGCGNCGSRLCICGAEDYTPNAQSENDKRKDAA